MITSTLRIPSYDAGITLSVRVKQPKHKTEFTGEDILLFIHGSGSSGCCWDIPLPGGSWMEYAASHGFLAYALDLRGYGSSTRPRTMLAHPSSAPPYCKTIDAVCDVTAVVEWILQEHSVDRINLAGWSWGGALAAQFAAEHNDTIARLGLYAPVHLLETPSPDTNDHYRLIREPAYRESSLLGIPAGREEEIFPSTWFEAVWQTVLASDPEGASMTPPFMRAPNGCVKDMYDFFSHGKAPYEPSHITVPVLICVGEWDTITPVGTALKLFHELTGTRDRRLVVLPESNHFMIHEKNRMMLIKGMHSFFEGNY